MTWCGQVVPLPSEWRSRPAADDALDQRRRSVIRHRMEGLHGVRIVRFGGLVQVRQRQRRACRCHAQTAFSSAVACCGLGTQKVCFYGVRRLPCKLQAAHCARACGLFFCTSADTGVHDARCRPPSAPGPTLPLACCRVPTSYDEASGVLTISHTPTHDTVHYAYFAPYTLDRHQRLLARMQVRGGPRPGTCQPGACNLSAWSLW